MMQGGAEQGEPLREHGPLKAPPMDEHAAEDISSIISRWLVRSRARERLGKSSIFGRWPEIVGEEIASSTRPVRLAGGVLTVEVASAPLLQELSTYRRREILEALRTRPEFRTIRDIRFRAGSRM
jgi:predicted nucleic acid-binding Zn ribbon protein